MRANWQLRDWLAYLQQRHPARIELGLERVSAVFARLGRPRPARKLITIAGTNGKGSVVAHLHALAASMRLDAGSYTSPHILAFNERYRIGREFARDAAIAAAFSRIESAREGVSLSYFEYATLAGYLLLAEAGLDVAFLEVGLGGRLDAVNILGADCAVITSIDIDHQEYLGDDREQIAREKAGIFRTRQMREQQIIIAERVPPESLREAARKSGQTVCYLGRDYDWQSAPGQRIRITGCGLPSLSLPPSPLIAPVQNDNLATATLALFSQFPRRRVDVAELERQFSAGILPGRLQRISSEPEIWVDVGHNPAAARVLADWLEKHPVPGKTRVLLAMLADKDAAGFAGILDPRVDRWLLAGLPGERGQSAAALAAKTPASVKHDCYPDVATALQAAVQQARPGDRLLVCGSFLTVEQAIRWRSE